MLSSTCFLLASIFLLTGSKLAIGSFATCGNCHCIPDNSTNGTCPTDDIPETEFPTELLSKFRSLIPIDPYALPCDPYVSNDTHPCETDPPQSPRELELGVDAFCAIQYEWQHDTESDCPTHYRVRTYDSRQDAENDGGSVVPTHAGACGVCSTTQDLAVYMEYPDLTTETTNCILTALDSNNTTKGVECLMVLGFTEACAAVWIYNGYSTNAACRDPCLSKVIQGRPNNGEPPNCTLDECLVCNEESSGLIFNRVAGRNRRRSGLLSNIVRPCGELIIVEHGDPCLAERPPAAPTSPPTTSGSYLWQENTVLFVCSIICSLLSM